MDDASAEPASINTSMFEVSMKMQSPCPTSMKCTVMFASVEDEVTGTKYIPIKATSKTARKAAVSLLLYTTLIVSSPV